MWTEVQNRSTVGGWDLILVGLTAGAWTACVFLPQGKGLGDLPVGRWLQKYMAVQSCQRAEPGAEDEKLLREAVSCPCPSGSRNQPSPVGTQELLPLNVELPPRVIDLYF